MRARKRAFVLQQLAPALMLILAGTVLFIMQSRTEL